MALRNKNYCISLNKKKRNNYIINTEILKTNSQNKC